MFPYWNWTMIVVSASFHSVAILSTVFRLWYRWYTARMWWDDAWAVLALLADVACLVATVIEQPIPNEEFPRFFTVGTWIVSFAYPTLMWATRISILTSMVHVSNPEGMLRRVIIGIGVFFAVMAIGMLGQRLQLCLSRACLMTWAVLISQTTMDCIADVLLTALPIWSFRKMKLRRKRKILIFSVFSASMVINVVTVMQAIAFFQSLTSGSIIFEHVKVACSMIVCNLLVIVTFVYRILHREGTGLEESVPDGNVYEFTTVDLAQVGLSQATSKAKSSVMTKSSTWSFRGGSRSATAAMSRIDALSTIGSEDEHYSRSAS